MIKRNQSGKKKNKKDKIKMKNQDYYDVDI